MNELYVKCQIESMYPYLNAKEVNYHLDYIMHNDLVVNGCDDDTLYIVIEEQVENN